VRTLRHFWPDFNPWLDELPDTRFQEMVVYDKRFLIWWGLLLFSLKLGSRRSLDYQLRDPELPVLNNVNQLAKTQQESLPVHKTLDHFLGHVGSAALADLRNQCVRQLMRNKVLDRFRLEGQFVIAIDGTGCLSFKERHCEHCLEHSNGSCVYYLHPVLEAKIVHPSGLALSIGTEFIENPLPQKPGADPLRSRRLPSRQTGLRTQSFPAPGPPIEKGFPANPLLSGRRFLAGLRSGFDALRAI